MLDKAKHLVAKEKEWLLSQTGAPSLLCYHCNATTNVAGLIPDCDDDVMDEVRGRFKPSQTKSLTIRLSSKNGALVLGFSFASLSS